MEWLELILGALTLLLGLGYWLTSNLDFWKSRGVSGPRPLPMLGNAKPVVMREKSFYQVTKDIYDAYKNEPMVGIFLMRDPALMIIDLELVKDVLVRDFAAFPDRGWKFFSNIEPLSQHLINLDVARWRPLRPKLSPVFATGKLKKMFDLLLECGEELDGYLEKLVAVDAVVDCHEMAASFLTDVVGLFFCGIKMNAMTDENSEFRKLGRQAFIADWRKILRFRLRQHVPWLYSRLGAALFDRKYDDFFMKVMLDIMDHRDRHRIVKNDFIDLLRNLRDHPDKVPDYELTDSLITSQLYVFFLAGFETSAVSMSHVLYELAQNQTMQDKLRDEINDQVSRCNGRLTYEGLGAMKYLDMIFQEVLRKYPPVSMLTRESAREYTFSNNVTIPKGTKIIIPVFAIHRDPRHYPKPDVFDPERFTDEATKDRNLMTDLAFGQGPRICIARRFANYQSKFGLFKILHRYKVHVCEQTQIPFVIEPRNTLLSLKTGPYVKFSKIN